MITRLLALSFFLTLSLNGITIRDAYTRQMETTQFQRVSEFFSGKENTGRQLILRSQSDNRDGLYFIIELSDHLDTAPAGSRFQLEVIPSDALKPSTFTFELNHSMNLKRKHVLLGLTGDDWESSELQPIAWRLKLQSGEDELASWKSFLWEMP